MHTDPWWFTPKLVYSVLIGYATIAIAYGLVMPWVHGDFEASGQFGDMFGAFNAVVSGIAMLGVVAAILLQREQNRMQAEELHFQRLELEETRKELRGQKEALEAQVGQQQRTSEAALMERLMADYDGLADHIAHIRHFNNSWGGADKGGQLIRKALSKDPHFLEPSQERSAEQANESRRTVSRFFVKVRRLATAGFVPDDLVVLSLERRAVEMFLSEVDPLDSAVADEHYSRVDRDYYQMLLDNRYPRG